MVAPIHTASRVQVGELSTNDLLRAIRGALQKAMRECIVGKLEIRQYGPDDHGKVWYRIEGTVTQKQNLGWTKGFDASFDPMKVYEMKEIYDLIKNIVKRVREEFQKGNTITLPSRN